jgi:hypothetical protein
MATQDGVAGLEKTGHRGVYKLDSDDEGKYLNKGDFTILPAVSGEGGYGGDGEYMKYPETEVITYETNKKNEGLKEIARKLVPSVDFTKATAEPVKATPMAVVPVQEQLPAKGGKKGKKLPVGNNMAQATREAIEVLKAPVAMKNVIYRGIFGTITVPYEHAFVEGNAMVLVNSSFQYDPPQNEEGFSVEIDGDEYNVYNVNLNFQIPGYGKRITVLLVEDQTDD